MTLAFSPAASAAQTRTLPAGETLYAIDCQTRSGQLGSVDTSTAVVTLIGSGTTDPARECAGPSAYDPNTGAVYWVSWSTPDFLFRIDRTTGESTYIGPVASPDGIVTNYFAMIMDPVLNEWFVLAPLDDDGKVYLHKLDTATGGLTTVSHLTIDGVDYVDNNSIWSAAYNPADGKAYFIDFLTLNSIDLETGEVTEIGENGDGSRWYGLAFDSAGVMWTTGSEQVDSSTVEGWTTAGTQQGSDDDTTVGGASWYSESNFINYSFDPPALAETGFDPVGYALGGVVLAAIGGAVLVVTRRTKA